MGAAPTNQGFWERLKKAEGNRSAETSGKHHWHAPVFGNVPRTATSRGTRDLTGVGCFRAGGSLPVRRWSVQAGRPGFAATDVGKRESGVPSMNEEAFAVHVLMSPFLHPRPSQSSGSPECGLERPGATLEVREPVRPRIDVVRRRAVNAATDRVTACAPTVGRDTSARNAPTAIAKRDESRHLGGRRTERADTDAVRDSSHPLYVGGGGVIHSQRTDESACAHSASSAMADCPPARPSQRSPRREGDTRVEQRAVALNHRRTGTTWPPSPTRRAAPAFGNVT